MLCRFPGQSCVVCGGEFVPGETEIDLHPTIKGPKGGSKYMHSGGCAKKNPAKARGLTSRGSTDLTARESREVEQILADFYAGAKQSQKTKPKAPRHNPRSR